MREYRCVCPCRCKSCWARTEFCTNCACHGDIFDRIRRGELVKPITYDVNGKVRA